MSELRDRNFNRIIDRYLTEGKVSAEDWDDLTPMQRDVVQVFKRSFKRITNKSEND